MELEIKAITDEIERISKENSLCRRLQQIPGFGPPVSTATVAASGNGSAFRCGRDFSAWVGIVPRQYSTGGKQKLFGISKRGNHFLSMVGTAQLHSSGIRFAFKHSSMQQSTPNAACDRSSRFVD